MLDLIQAFGVMEGGEKNGGTQKRLDLSGHYIISLMYCGLLLN